MLTDRNKYLCLKMWQDPTAREFIEMLPLTVELWDDAPGFARAVVLPEQIAENGTPGYEFLRNTMQCSSWEDNMVQ